MKVVLPLLHTWYIYILTSKLYVINKDYKITTFPGDIMGPVLANIDALVRMPYGCGEQNMINFVPNIVVLRYLKATKRAGAQIEAKALKYMEAGYQRELTYRYFFVFCSVVNSYTDVVGVVFT